MAYDVNDIREELQKVRDSLFFIEVMMEDVAGVTGNFPPRPARSRSAPMKKRKASPWNDFVAAEMPKVLKKHPRFTPQRAMKEVSRRWKTSPKNPNRRKKR